MKRQKHIVNPEKKLGTIKKNAGIGYLLFTYAKGAATDVLIVTDYATDFIRCIHLDAYTQTKDTCKSGTNRL